MKALLILAAMAALYFSVDCKYSPPKVVLYSHKPGMHGKENMLICHVTDFHPPDITIELLKDSESLLSAEETDLAFKQNWHFHLTKNATFTPVEGQKYTCRVTHGSKVSNVEWESNM